MSEGRLKTLLIASLAVNLLLIGGGVGAYVAGVRLDRPGPERDHRDGRGPRPDVGPGGGGFMRALDEASREAIRRELRGAWGQTQELRAAARAARQDVERVATAATYDAEAVRAALARQRAADAALQAAWHDAMARALVDLKPEERQEAVKALVRERRRALGGPMGEGARERMKQFRDGRLEDDAPPGPPGPPPPP
ncbi:MAG: periplasmic heavy metal sensor [Hyphomonadaceae bacterium]|nr:periplasmic heavy metal sensor [Hyphomonadaceae bacterium]